MTDQIRDHLTPVNTRQHRMLLLRYAAVGLLLGSVFGLLLGVARLQGGDVTPLGAIAAAVAGILGGLLLGWFRTPSWQQSAKAVDAHYQLKDRSVTAVEFSNKSEVSELHQLQLRDAVHHLVNINAEDVVPFHVPRLLPIAAVAFAAVTALAVVPVVHRNAGAKTLPPLEIVVDEAEYLEKTMVEDLKQISEEADETKIEKLAEQLEALLQEMKEEGVDKREALAKLSEMQAAVAAAQSEFNMDLIDAQFNAIGDAIKAAASMQSAADALQEGDYDKASEKLENIDVASITQKEAKSVAKDLKKLSKQMADAGLEQLSEATSELAKGLEKGLEKGEGDECASATRKLAKLSRNYSLRKKVGESLGRQLSRLSESKENCSQDGARAETKQLNPSNSWGRGTGGEPLGAESTQIIGTRHEERVTGTAGEGPSEREVTHSPEGREAAMRQPHQVFKEYRKQAEEVLQSEALPLGHRQTIRHYFESIRPRNDDEFEDDDPS